MVRYVSNHAAYSLFKFPLGLLAVPHLRCESGSAPLQLYLEGGIPGTDGNAAHVLFRETEVGQCMHATLTSRRGCQRANNRRGRGGL